jgi:hypothetical protein
MRVQTWRNSHKCRRLLLRKISRIAEMRPLAMIWETSEQDERTANAVAAQVSVPFELATPRGSLTA